MTKDLREVCRALIVDESAEKVFLAKRADGDGYAAGLWSLFGGKIDPGETPLQAVIREVKEEAGVQFIPQPYMVQENDEWRTYFFTGHIAGKLTLSLAEHSQAGYFSIDEIETMPLAFDHLDVIKDYMHSIKSRGDRPCSA